MGYIRMITGSVMAVLFILAITIFAVQFANENDSAISLGDDSRYTNLNSTLRSNITTLEDEAQSSQEIFFKTTLDSGDEHASSGAQFKIGPLTAVSMALSSFSVAFGSIFGSEFGFLATAFVALMTMLLFYFSIKAWLGRSPE